MKEEKEKASKKITMSAPGLLENPTQDRGEDVRWLEGEKEGRVLVLLRRVYGRARRESQDLRKEKPRSKTGSCCLRWSIRSRRGKAVAGAGLPASLPCPERGSLFQHFGLKET